MTTPTVAEVVAALRSYAEDPYSGGSYTDELRARQAADLLEREHRARTEAEAYIASLPADWRKDSSLRTWFPLSADALERAERELAESERKLNIANGTIANLMDAKCHYVVTSHEGTSYCTLAESTGKELAELRKRIDEAPRGMVRGFMLEPETQPGWLDKMGGKRVAIVPLREGE